MKYFTPESLARFESSDGDEFAEAHDDWERALALYRRHWRKIKNSFPESVRRFEDAQLKVHDAQVLSMGRQDSRFIMVLETEAPNSQLVVLNFTLAAEPELDPNAIPGRQGASPVLWLYEEWNLDRHKNLWFEGLFSNGSMVKLRFLDFDFLVLQKLLPARNGQRTQEVQAAVSPRA